jgi:hypothetical protein
MATIYQTRAADAPPSGPAVLGGLDELERHGQAGGVAAWSFGDRVLRRTVAKVDSIGLDVRRWTQRLYSRRIHGRRMRSWIMWRGACSAPG